MAKKRKKRKIQFKKQVKFELLGLLFITIAIFGSGVGLINDGFIPKNLEYLYRFFFGVWYFVISIFLFITGLKLMIKRKYPNFFVKKMIGLYIVFGGLLLFTHIQSFQNLTIMERDVSTIGVTWDHYLNYIQSNEISSQIGGGMLGGVLYAITGFLFSSIGAKIFSILLILVGIIFITDLSVGDFISKLTKRIETLGSNLNRKRKQLKLEKTIKKKEKQKEFAKDDMTNKDKLDSNNSEKPIIQDFSELIQKQEEDNIKPLVEKNENLKEDTEKMPLTENENYAYILPTIDLLDKPRKNTQQKEHSQIEETAKKLESTFKSFGVKAKISKIHVGPSVTKYEVYPEAGVKVSRIVSLHDDLALALAAKDIRIEAPIPGKSAVGIEVPNQDVAMVSLREVLETAKPSSSKLSFALGRDISGDAVLGELNKMPHMLIAGATGSGKSVCINGIITSILMRAKPHEVKMMMIDPKKVELNVYNGIPHLLAPVVTDPKKASQALKKVVSEMERRYDLFSDTGARNIEGYNEHIRRVNIENDEEYPNLPYIVVLVDELADLMMVASSDVEDAITRLAQMARAAGIHLIIATQRPSVDVITGVIKANIPSRIAFSVSSQIDSRTILDSGGAEKLLGRGDMLFMPVGTSKPTRVQGAFLSDDEVERIVNHCIEQQKANYQQEMIPDEVSEVTEEVGDELYEDAVKMIVDMQTASVSMLQRRFRIGYTRAARLIDAMEDRNIIGPYEGSKPRTVLITNMEEIQSKPT